METILYNKKGEPVAYLTSDFRETIYLWEGVPVGYMHEGEHVYGINGRHLGWFKDDIFYNNEGERIGFTFSTCPVSVAKRPAKGNKSFADEPRPRWSVPPSPNFGFKIAEGELSDLLKEGLVSRQKKYPGKEEPHEKKS
ncbi:MAG: hypothetical protein JRJ66_01660 [Deltaproteobacteria bacterium]|nr:hypothetical protein [Deltaproteobacteria bacterium]MBW2043633.1 hypothetical protein [Deltaproteobacteria bacterium]RLB35262.1 MAG: hypothetical protein DRH11_03405 [Deltaproteobacteria bacterium]